MTHYRTIKVDRAVGPVGAVIGGVDLSKPLADEVIAEIHSAWLEHHVAVSYTHLTLPTICSV